MNYYLPDNSRYLDNRHFEHHRDVYVGANPPVVGNGFIVTEHNRTVETTTTKFRRLETGLEGIYAEGGFLVPGLDRYFELRIFGGGFHYNNQFGTDYNGFQSRIEARLLPGIIADATYLTDARVNGAHWTYGVRVSVPFDLGNLFRGKNPFEGIADSFKAGPREFKSRMNEMVLRSPRIKTVAGEADPETETEVTKNTTVTRTPIFIEDGDE